MIDVLLIEIVFGERNVQYSARRVMASLCQYRALAGSESSLSSSHSSCSTLLHLEHTGGESSGRFAQDRLRSFRSMAAGQLLLFPDLTSYIQKYHLYSVPVNLIFDRTTMDL